MIKEQHQEPHLVIFDDDAQDIQELELENCSPEKQEIYLFDDEDGEQLQESKVENTKGEVQREENGMTNQQFKKRCSRIQDRIILSNLSNFGGMKAAKEEKTFFKEAKERRASNELAYQRRKSRNIEEITFEPKSVNVKVNFNPDKMRNNFMRVQHPAKENIQRIEESLSDEIEPNLSTQGLKQNFNGALVERKNELKIEEIKDKSSIKVSNFREFLYTQLNPSYCIYLLIKKTDSGLINNTYKIYFQENKKFILSCQKQGFSKYVFSTSDIHITEDHISYMGKMESNFFGTEFIMYDAGQDHTKTKMMENYKKQLAFIQYRQDGPLRTIETLFTTCDNKSTQFTIKDKNDNLLQSKYENNSKRNICKMVSKEPTFDRQEQNYKLDFRGINGIPSIKNFILQNPTCPDALIFGRRDKENYLMRVKAPFSIMQAVAIAMSSIHHKFL